MDSPFKGKQKDEILFTISGIQDYVFIASLAHIVMISHPLL